MPADYYSKTLTASQVSKGGKGLKDYYTGLLLSCSYEPVNLRKVRNLSGFHLSLCTVGLLGSSRKS